MRLNVIDESAEMMEVELFNGFVQPSLAASEGGCASSAIACIDA